MPPLFAETFDDPDSGLPHGEQNDTRWGYADGAYQLFISAANRMQTRLLGSPLQDYDATIEARFASENLGSYGLVAAARGPNDYYALVVDGDQRYAITRRTAEGTRVIQDWIYTSALNEARSLNRLRVVQRGGELAFFANDVLLKVVQMEGGVPAPRYIGLTASSFGTGTDVRFDNLKVCAPPENLASRQIALSDSFDDNHNGWAPQQYTAKGGSSIENGQFVIETHYITDTYAVLNWNPNIAFDAVNLRVDTRIMSGTRTSRVGVIFGVQDLENYYWFDMSESGRYHLYRMQDNVSRLISNGTSPFIHTNLTRNQIQLSIISNTLSVAINDRMVMQAAIDYMPGYVGFYCGAYQPDQTLCAFDNLQVTGSPSLNQALLYPFCNCRRTVMVGQPLEVRWQWGAKSIDYLDQFKAGTTLSVTLDGVPVESPKQYWTPARMRKGEAEMFWSQLLPPLDPGSHLIEFVVSSDQSLTDGLDENGDGQLDTFGPGNILAGYVEAIVMP
jgi:hypothetical protein